MTNPTLETVMKINAAMIRHKHAIAQLSQSAVAALVASLGAEDSDHAAKKLAIREVNAV